MTSVLRCECVIYVLYMGFRIMIILDEWREINNFRLRLDKDIYTYGLICTKYSAITLSARPERTLRPLALGTRGWRRRRPAARVKGCIWNPWLYIYLDSLCAGTDFAP